MGVYLYPSGTETELKHVYIGEYSNILQDTFPGTSLNTNIWGTYYYNNNTSYGSPVVNNELTLSTTGGGSNNPAGPSIYTLRNFSGTESKITYEISGVNGMSSNYADTGLQIALLGNGATEASSNFVGTQPPAYVFMFKTKCKVWVAGGSKTAVSTLVSGDSISYTSSTVFKFELTPSTRQVKVYLDGTLKYTHTYGNYDYTNQPLLALGTQAWTRITAKVGSVKVTVE